MNRLLVTLLLGAWLCTSQAIAHTFFVGSTEILVNEHTKSVEVIHRFTSHDVEAMLSYQHQQRVDVESDEYLQMIRDYVAKGFSLTGKDGKELPLAFVGIEAGINETFIYQEIEGITDIKGVVVNHHLLADYFLNQKNRVNFESSTVKGSLLFDNNIKKLEIK